MAAPTKAPTKRGEAPAAPKTDAGLPAKKATPKAEAANGKSPKTVARKQNAVPAAEAPALKEEKRVKKAKVKIVRDSFTMPDHDHEKLAKLKKKCLEAGVQVKKNELLRAGLAALEIMPVKRLLTELRALDKVKTGRPVKA